MYPVDNFMVCTDCWNWHQANLDYFSYYNVSAERVWEVNSSVERLQEYKNKDGEKKIGILHDGEDHTEFTYMSCECCKSPLGGERFELILMGC